MRREDERPSEAQREGEGDEFVEGREVGSKRRVCETASDQRRSNRGQKGGGLEDSGALKLGLDKPLERIVSRNT